MTVIDCPNITGAKAPIAPVLNTPLSTVEISQNFVAFSEYMNFNKTQNQRGREANDCVVPLTRYHFSFLTSIPFPSILLVSKYSFLFFYWILSFSLFLFSYIPFLLIVVYLILDFFQIFIAVIQKLQFRNEPEWRKIIFHTLHTKSLLPKIQQTKTAVMKI